MKKWYCTDCEDTFNDPDGERCPMCGFRRVVGPFKYANRHDIKDALRDGAIAQPDR